MVVGKQQWRFSSTSPVQIYNFPISFSSAPFVCVTGNTMRMDSTDTDGWEDVIGVTNITATGFRVTTPASTRHSVEVIAIGKQQWGMANLDEHDAVRTINFPVSYSSSVFAITAYCYDNKNKNEYINNAWTVSWSTTSFVFKQYQYESQYSWIAIGMQQWGKLNDYQVTFPLTFPTIVYFVGGSHIEYANGFGGSCVPSSISLNGFTDYTSQNNNARNWVALGK